MSRRAPSATSMTTSSRRSASRRRRGRLRNEVRPWTCVPRRGAARRLWRGVGRACLRAPIGGDTKMKTKTLLYALALWLWAIGLAAAQTNSIESFEVLQQGGKTVVRVTTKEPLRSVPPNFAVANPARIAFDFPNTVNALGRSNQEIGQVQLRSMNIVQGADRTPLA